MLNGERYKEVCPDGGLLPAGMLASCVLESSNPKKPLLKREGGGGVTDEGRIMLLPEVRCLTGFDRL